MPAVPLIGDAEAGDRALTAAAAGGERLFVTARAVETLLLGQEGPRVERCLAHAADEARLVPVGRLVGDLRRPGGDCGATGAAGWRTGLAATVGTQRLAVPQCKRTTFERSPAGTAREAAGMPVSAAVGELATAEFNPLLAAEADGRTGSAVTLETQRRAEPQRETARLERHRTPVTRQVLAVPGESERAHKLPGEHELVTGGAARPESLAVVSQTQRLAAQLTEHEVSQRLGAVGTREAGRVPGGAGEAARGDGQCAGADGMPTPAADGAGGEPRHHAGLQRQPPPRGRPLCERAALIGADMSAAGQGEVLRGQLPQQPARPLPLAWRS